MNKEEAMKEFSALYDAEYQELVKYCETRLTAMGLTDDDTVEDNRFKTLGIVLLMHGITSLLQSGTDMKAILQKVREFPASDVVKQLRGIAQERHEKTH